MGATKKDHENRIGKRIVNQKSYKPDFTRTEKDDIDIWEWHVKERERILTQIAKYRRTNRIRSLVEIIFMLGFICYMLYDIYKDV